MEKYVKIYNTINYYIGTTKGETEMDIEVLRNLEGLGINAMYIHENGVSINLNPEDIGGRERIIKGYISVNLLTDEIPHV